MEIKFGKYVKDYILLNYEDISLGWRWKSLEDLDLLENKINLLKDILQNKRITISRDEYIIIWNEAKSREYTIKEGYNYLNNKQPLPKTNLRINLCWECWCN